MMKESDYYAETIFEVWFVENDNSKWDKLRCYISTWLLNEAFWTTKYHFSCYEVVLQGKIEKISLEYVEPSDMNTDIIYVNEVLSEEQTFQVPTKLDYQSIVTHHSCWTSTIGSRSI